MDNISNWFKSLPIFTRYWFALSVAFPVAGRLGLISPYLVILNDHFIKKFQIWRPVTALFYYPLGGGSGFHYLMNLYFLYNYSIRLETGTFNGRPADYLFLLLFNWISITIVAYWCNIMLLMDPMILSVLYIWSQLNKDVIVTFWFGTQFKAMYLPWVLLGFNMIMGGGGLFELIGIIVGHLYYFLVFKYPEMHGGSPLIETPAILYDYFPSTPGRGGIYAQPPASTAYTRQERTPGHQWGRGHTLGRS
ncbi:Derlin-1-like protein [Dinothrombium tinctorium]|uniref:Derlin n=1 Tax=Dinothrombium tinctorium TaxID=1965070 RepID=A0A3S3PLT2_9ACAR|nr:Derlin-1-like protein [Dinothrombium tinctorium]RWS10420.1 Derlin-1-like protein [Dinothrombium tinctorium]RWS12333.1 Derlin-1-like protein [Dinothrombium tinctorium]